MGAKSATLEQVRSVLGQLPAAVKLMVINRGVAVDGTALAAAFDDYPEAFRTKRAKARHGLSDGDFVDQEQAAVTSIPTEVRVSFGDDDSVIKVNRDPASPFALRLQDGALRLVSEVDGLDYPASLVRRPAATRLDVDGAPAVDWVQVLGLDRIGIMVYLGCANWFHGNQCKFCDSITVRPGERRALPSLNALRRRFALPDGGYDHAAWWREVGPGLKAGVRRALGPILADPDVGPHAHLHVMAGNLLDVDAEWDAVLELSEELSQVVRLQDVDAYLNLLPPPDPDKLQRAHALGFGKLIFNLEAYGEATFAEICPGKHKLMPYPRYLRRMEQAVEIFGRGNVYSGLVLGLQPVEALRRGVADLARRGIAPEYSSFTPKRGTPYADKPRPDLLETARFARLLADLYQQHGFSPMYCRLSARSSIMSELCDA